MAASPRAGGRAAKAWEVAKAIAYELRPFSPPSLSRLQEVGASARGVLSILAECVREAGRAASRVSTGQWCVLGSWLGGWIACSWFGFGSIYFLLSALVTMFVNLRSAAPGEVSAYSVFNQGFRELMGTMNAEQFDREIRRQPMGAPAGRNHEGDAEDDDGYVLLDGARLRQRRVG